MSLVLGPVAFEVSIGAIPDLDDRLPTPNSLRRASAEAKAAVLAASQVLDGWPKDRRDRLGLYVSQQRGGLEYVTQFLDTAFKEGPRFASPLHFSESVANNAATHLSLTFGFTGVVGTYIGSRVAGIQALLAAQEDIETGAADAGLIVVQNYPTQLTHEAYRAVYAPGKRRSPLQKSPLLSGSIAFLVRPAPAEGAPLLFAGTRCAGRSRQAVRSALASLWKEFRATCGLELRLVPSVLALDAARAIPLIREVLEDDVPGDLPNEESYPLDPFLRLFRDVPSGPRGVVTLSEEGTVGLLALAD